LRGEKYFDFIGITLTDGLLFKEKDLDEDEKNIQLSPSVEEVLALGTHLSYRVPLFPSTRGSGYQKKKKKKHRGGTHPLYLPPRSPPPSSANVPIGPGGEGSRGC